MGHDKNESSNRLAQRFTSSTDKFKYAFLTPLFKFLNSLNVTPNQLTGFAFLLAMISLYFLYTKDYLTFTIFVALNFFIDSIDGTYARFAKKETKAGTMFDFFSDYTYFLFVLFIFLYQELAHPVLIGLTIGFFLYHEILYFVLKELDCTKVPFRFTNIVLIAPIFNLIPQILIIVLVTAILGSLRAFYYIFRFYLRGKT
jgi:phosphatidylglycerophosphate synthase